MQYSVVNYKTVKENLSFRIDADFFRPDYLEILNELQNRKHESLKNKDRRVFSGPFGSFLKSESYQEAGYPFIRISDIKDVYIEKEGMVYLNDDEFKRVKKYQLDVNDIVFSKIGTVGRLSLITEELGKVAISENNIGIEFSKNVDIKNRFYIFAFLLSRYGQKQIFRLSSGNVQPKLNVSDIENLYLPVVSDNFSKKIYQLVLSSQLKYQSSKSLYSQAEQLLLSELGLLEWKPKHTLSFVKNFSNTKESDRFDAEYFQPKYEEIIEAVKKYKGGFVELGEVAKTKRGSLISDTFYNENNGVPYIRGADFSSGFLSDSKLVYINDSFSSKSETKIKKDDIVFALIGTVGAIALVDENFDGAFISNNLGKITAKTYNSTVLQVLLHSIVGKLYFEKEQTQTAQPKISDKDIHKFILPKLEYKLEKAVEKKYFESQNNKKLSKSLLEIAKRGVEITIEKDEKEAKKWIDSEIKSLEIKL